MQRDLHTCVAFTCAHISPFSLKLVCIDSIFVALDIEVAALVETGRLDEGPHPINSLESKQGRGHN